MAGRRRARPWPGSATSTCRRARYAYLDGREATVAGVPSLLLRIGFVGEAGYEISSPILGQTVPFRLERFYEVEFVSELAAAAVSH